MLPDTYTFKSCSIHHEPLGSFLLRLPLQLKGVGSITMSGERHQMVTHDVGVEVLVIVFPFYLLVILIMRQISFWTLQPMLFYLVFTMSL